MGEETFHKESCSGIDNTSHTQSGVFGEKTVVWWIRDSHWYSPKLCLLYSDEEENKWISLELHSKIPPHGHFFFPPLHFAFCLAVWEDLIDCFPLQNPGTYCFLFWAKLLAVAKDCLNPPDAGITVLRTLCRGRTDNFILWTGGGGLNPLANAVTDLSRVILLPGSRENNKIIIQKKTF